MKAVVSDIHANLEAFKVVMADIKSHGVTNIISLGDFIGYGPNPKECIDMAAGFQITLKGNHEEALLEEFQSAAFNLRARQSIDWTREQLSMLSADREANAGRWDFLGGLETVHKDDRIMYVHGTPRNPTNEYLYPRDVYRPGKMIAIFAHVDHLCFVGHSHVPGVWTEDMVFRSPDEVEFEHRVEGKKTIVNVGSVGQPRDGDPRACYVLFEGMTVRFRKLPYPVEKTVQRIHGIPAIDPSLGERLKKGR